MAENDFDDDPFDLEAGDEAFEAETAASEEIEAPAAEASSEAVEQPGRKDDAPARRGGGLGSAKLKTALVSLVAAIPGAALTVFVVVAFWRHAESMSGLLLGLSAVTLLVSAAATLMPIGIFLFSPKEPEAGTPGSASDAGIAASESGEMDSTSAPATMEGIAVSDAPETLEGVAFSDSEIEEAEGEEFDLGDFESDAEAPHAETTEEDFDFDFEDEDEK